MSNLDLFGDPIAEEEEYVANKDVGFFDFFDDLTHKQKNIMRNSDIWNIEEQYIPYNMNKALSQSSDSIIYVNDMNALPHLPNRLQYDYFINSIRPRSRRMEKWLRTEDVNEAIKEYYNYSNQKAKDALSILDESEIEYIKSKTYKGGKENDKC